MAVCVLYALVPRHSTGSLLSLVVFTLLCTLFSMTVRLILAEGSGWQIVPSASVKFTTLLWFAIQH